MSAVSVVQVENLDVYYGTSQILFGVGLDVQAGDTMALLGRNGAGKSTYMKLLAGELGAMGGTRTEAPVSSLAGFCPPVAVSPRRPGSVSSCAE